MELSTKLEERTARVAVIGLGYVGLPLAIQAAHTGFEVVGVDRDEAKVSAIRAGTSHLEDIDDEELNRHLGSGRLTVTVDPASLAGCDVILICVPSPLKQDLPDVSYIEAAARDVAQSLGIGRLVVLESTTYPGTTEELLLPILESSGLKAGIDFFLGFSPERIDPGNERYGLQNVPKIIGGIDTVSTDLMETFYSALVDKVVRVTSPRTAEMTKLLENTYRHVNIALVNEMAILCRDLGIDIWEVIDAAATKPFGFQPFYPGPGWGGHCIPVDPAYLSWRVRQMGATARFVELAREFNQKMPGYVTQRAQEALNDVGRSLKGASILVLGVAYKPGISDTRESPAIEIIERLTKGGAEVSYNDPFCPELEIKGRTTLRSVDLEDIGNYDLVLVHTHHPSYDWQAIAGSARLILDTRNALMGLDGPIVKL